MRKSAISTCSNDSLENSLSRAMGRYLCLLLVFATLFVWISTAPAAVVLDQEFVASNRNTFLLDSRQQAQIFTVGQTGILDSVDLQIHKRGAPTDLLNFDIRPLSGSTPDTADANALASLSFSESFISSTRESFVSIDLSSFGIGVTAGDMFALVASSAASSLSDSYLWTHLVDTGGGDPFADGSACTRASSLNNWACYDFSGFQQDYGFRSYVEVNPVPVPAAFWLFGTALAGFAGLTRRRNTG